MQFKTTHCILLSCPFKLLQLRTVSLFLPFHELDSFWRVQTSYFTEGPSVCSLMIRFRLWIWGWSNTEVMCPSQCFVSVPWLVDFSHLDNVMMPGFSTVKCKGIIFPLLSTVICGQTLQDMWISSHSLVLVSLDDFCLNQLLWWWQNGDFSKSIMSSSFPIGSLL